MSDGGLYDVFQGAENELEGYERVLEIIDKTDDDIKTPDTSGLFNERVNVNYENVLNDVKVNGVWVHPFFVKLVNMLHNGESPIIIVVGKEGRGKSMTGLKIAQILHKIGCLTGSFNPSRQVVYEVIPFLLLYGDSTRSAVMFDEANETLNVADYHDDFNKAVAGVLRTQRKRENVNIFVCPEYKQLDKRVRSKVDVLINMKGKQYASITTYEYKHDKRGNRGLDYKWQDYPDWSVPDVPKQLMNEYEQIDDAFKGYYHNKLLAKAIRERLTEIENKSTASF